MNHLNEIKKFKNNYYIMRHGQSKSNIKKVIAGHPKNCITKYGLTEVGKQQAEESAKKCKEISSKAIIYHSDFRRARETAHIAKKIFGIKDIRKSKRLRERYCGSLEGKSAKRIHELYKADEKDENHRKFGCQTLREIESQITSIIKYLETIHKNKTILLVSHGDALQILQNAAKKLHPTKYTKIKYMPNAEIRKLKLN